jgi:hypothetical protein
MQYLRITDSSSLRRGIYFAIVPGLLLWFVLIEAMVWFWSWM